ncbi:MAG: phosphopyruvate hydratase [Eubacteriales bacterium]
MCIQTDCIISQITARQIIDSRGTPTVEATVVLRSGVCASASVPSGASTGMYEACELRDNGSDFFGKAVTKAVFNVRDIIDRELAGMRADHQVQIDKKLIALDGSPNKEILGANAILAVSIACARASAKAYSIPLFRYLGGSEARILPIPMMNILNGGAHASNNLDIQEFMIMPIGAENFTEAMRMGCEVYGNLKKLLKQSGLSVSIGDEGGFAPDLPGDEKALEFLVDAIESAGYRPGEQIAIALDIASSEWAKNGGYHLPKANRQLDAKELMNYYTRLCESYPIVSIEDPFSENDFDSFTEFTKMSAGSGRVGPLDMKSGLQIVGDDLFVTNRSRLESGIVKGAANAVLIKPNQIGTLTETVETVKLAAEHGYRAILSHRSGETEDTIIADLAVALGTGQIKTGAPARGERVCKYNRLLRIENALGSAAKYGKI